MKHLNRGSRVLSMRSDERKEYKKFREGILTDLGLAAV